MSEPFLAEIKMVGFNFAPRGWGFCDGQILPINQNQALFSLLGTMYGGDGRSTFALPDLRGRTPIHPTTHFPGIKGGEEGVSLSVNQMPSHSHQLNASDTDASSADPEGNLLARASEEIYGAPANLVNMADPPVDNAGGGQAHNNMQPSLVVGFVIALVGLFPPRN